MADPIVPPVYTTPAPAGGQKNVKTPRTRMGKRLAPIPLVYDRDKEKGKATVKAVAKQARKKLPGALTSKAPVDEQYNTRVYFSEAFGPDAGKVYSEPLEIEDLAEWAGKEFYWRVEIDQFRVDPLLQGFQTTWSLLTPGWSFVDGYGAVLYDEAISNPLKVTRVIKAPGSITVRPKFRLVVTEKYLP